MDNDSGDRDVVAEMRRQGYGILTTHEAGNSHLSDEEQLRFARDEGRVLFSANVRDFSRIHREWLTGGRNHAGIIVRFDQRMPVGLQVVRLIDICRHLEPVDLADQLLFLDGWRLP
jgi:hypothetical protein